MEVYDLIKCSRGSFERRARCMKLISAYDITAIRASLLMVLLEQDDNR